MQQPTVNRDCKALTGSRPLLAAVAVASMALCAVGCKTGPFKVAEASPTAISGHTHPGAADKNVVNQARALRVAGRYEEALMLLSKALMEHPGDPDLRRETGALHEALGHSDLAREAYESVLLANPTDIGALEALGVLHLQAGRLELARGNLHRAVQLDKQRVRATSPMGEVDADSPVLAYNGLGVIADREGDHGQAATLFMTALQIEKSPLLYTNLGYSRFLGENFGAAEWAYQQALLLDPEYQPAIRNLAMLYAKRGNYERARSMLLKTDNEAAALMDLARLARANGDNAIALQVFEQLAGTEQGQNAFVMNQVEELRALLGQKAGPEIVYSVRARMLRVRDRNSMEGEIIAFLPEGTVLEVLEKADGWYLVEYTHTRSGHREQGWVASRFVSESSI